MQQLNDSFVINYNTWGVRGFSSIGYKAPTDLTYDEWANAGEVIKRIDRFKNFAIGDWLNVGEYRFGEMYSQAIDEFEWGDYNKLSKLKWVARSVPPANRRADLTWSHHHYIASLPPNEQIEWLEHAASYSLTASELNGAIKDKKQATSIATRNELPPAPHAQPNTDDDTQPGRTLSPPSAYATRNDYHATDDIDDRAEYLEAAPDAYDVPFSHHRTDCAAYADLWPDERIDAMVQSVAIEATDDDGVTWRTVLADDVCRLLRTMRSEFEAIR
ncbi:MAG: hypothetical protein E6Q97_10235 [Desulfurellales bacterium]|nr:MAG: hypothetical protein E6Q97_10235 [Desulfurellales bacterium]